MHELPDQIFLRAAIEVASQFADHDTQVSTDPRQVEQVDGGFWVPCRMWVSDSDVLDYLGGQLCAAVQTPTILTKGGAS